ncbi:hypothetical protein BGW38_004535 [Lunasporangiospora selenospora]|uniref:Fe2OG dioxygenase domain-containing protein n=1 Tax=Lunasporangiospora selenospora TaxID=979761 RepID=A0A9P6G2T1_9FUNG|nr:hypothetical protein BGW38_004535 [Lunasporangiospora selenospora]
MVCLPGLMDQLHCELFGSDSDLASDLDSDVDLDQEPLSPSHQGFSFSAHDGSEDNGWAQIDDMDMDPIFRDIMESVPADDVSSFISSEPLEPQPMHHPYPHIPGLCVHTNVLSHGDQSKLIGQITNRNFFRAGQQNQAMCFGENDLAWIKWIELLLSTSGTLSEPYCSSTWTTRQPLFDQSIMNLYYPGNGIKPHVDLARFEDGIIIISLLSSITMDFYPARAPMKPEDPVEGTYTADRAYTTRSGNDGMDGEQIEKGEEPTKYSVRLEPGSVVTLNGPARYEWEHGIQERIDDVVNGDIVKRKIRVSVTLRKMRPAAWDVGPSDGSINGEADRKLATN